MSNTQNISIDPATLQKLQSEIKSNNLKYLVPSYVDMHGIPKAKMVPVNYLERMLGGSELFTGAALDGVPQNMAGDTVDAMNKLGWSVYSFDHEDGVGHFELDFQYTDALSMSDRFVFLRVMVNEFARKHDCFASFMPKPFADKAGSGAHFNMSIAHPTAHA